MLAVLTLMMVAGFDPSVLTVPHDPIEEQKVAWMNALADCESGGNDTVKVWDTNSQWSVGKYQYQYRTWLKYSKKFGTTRENITDGDLQDKVTRYILDHGGRDNWFNCANRVETKLGEYPL